MRQHVIDPDICVSCMSCLPVCPSGAIVTVDRTMAIDPDRCAGHGACIAECSTGAIDSWIEVSEGEAYPVAEQLEWVRLPGPAMA